MKNHIFFGLILFIFSCNKTPCECDFIDIHYIECKIVNQQGQNFIFGPSALYKIDSIQVLKEYNNLNINNASVRKGLIDSTGLRFDFYVRETKSYIYYNKQTPEDSVEIKWLTKTGKCCGGPEEYYTVDSVKFNNVFIKPVNGVYTFVK